ncbi:MAG: T9SS type A sorting domain-containing protein, partial [Bacteroidales bacterium]|nr:T9SS type A sorting domain-containing protein [Bacteroidales bacterium]
ALSAIAGDADAYLDFYQYHWYPWQSEWMDSPFTQTTVAYEVDDRPVIVGESEGNDVCDAFVCQTVSEMYESAWQNGFDGVCAWKTPQNDGHGTFENIAVATNAFYNNHPHLVYPSGSTDPEIPIDYYTLEVSTDGQGSVTVVPMNEEYPAGSSVTVSANASAGYRFSHWSGILEGNTSSMVITINEHLQLRAHFVEHTVVDPCANAQVIALPFSFDGVGEYCWVSDQTIAFVNSWNMELLEINGVDYTNKWSNTLPEPIDGKYFIRYMGNYGWSHFEAPQTKVASGTDLAKAIRSAALFPNPFKEEMTLNLSGFKKVEVVTITDLSGVVVETIVPQETILQIGQNLESGTYIVLVKGAGALKSFKITKQ